MPASPTAAQSAASRANGALSRGPTTPEGKARAALNGTRHGLRGSTTLLPDEDPAAWTALLRGYLARLRPADAAELACVERLAACDWREARLLRRDGDAVHPSRRHDRTRPAPRLVAHPAALPGCGPARPQGGAGAARDAAVLPPSPAGRPDRGRRRPAALDGRADRAQARGDAGGTGERHARTRAACGGQPEQAPEQAAEAPPQPSNDDTPEPEQPQAGPPRPPLNREQRRRLAALARRVQPGAVSSSVCAGSP